MSSKKGRIISPLVNQLRNYELSSIGRDLNAAMAITVLLIPQGLAYAMLVGVPPIYGFYGAVLPVILYAIFGTSKFLQVGPVAISCILVFQGVSLIAEPFTPEYIQLVITCGFYVGILQLLLGMMQVGALVNFIANPVIKGFIAAASLIIVCSQLKDAFGLKVERGPSILHNLFEIFKNIHLANWYAFAIFAGSVIMMIVIKLINRKLPRAFITVVLAMVATKLFDLDLLGVEILGSISRGLPSITLPTIDGTTFRLLLPTVLTLTIVNLVECISIGKSMEDKTHSIKPNPEFIALGISKIGGALTGAFPTSGSFSRSAVAKDGQASGQLSSIIAALFVLLTLLFLTPLLYYIPDATLAAVIIVSVLKLFNVGSFKHLYKTHRRDFIVMVATFITSLALNIEFGILVGVILSLILVLQQSSKPRIAVLGRVPNTTNFRNTNVLKDLEVVDGALIIRLEDQLFFGNNEYFDEQIRELVENHSTPLDVLFLDAKSIFQIDSSGVDTLFDVHEYLSEKEIKLYICGGMARFRKQLSKSGFTKTLEPSSIQLSLHKAIAHYKSQNDDK